MSYGPSGPLGGRAGLTVHPTRWYYSGTSLKRL